MPGVASPAPCRSGSAGSAYPTSPTIRWTSGASWRTASARSCPRYRCLSTSPSRSVCFSGSQRTTSTRKSLIGQCVYVQKEMVKLLKLKVKIKLIIRFQLFFYDTGRPSARTATSKWPTSRRSQYRATRPRLHGLANPSIHCWARHSNATVRTIWAGAPYPSKWAIIRQWWHSSARVEIGAAGKSLPWPPNSAESIFRWEPDLEF